MAEVNIADHLNQGFDTTTDFKRFGMFWSYALMIRYEFEIHLLGLYLNLFLNISLKYFNPIQCQQVQETTKKKFLQLKIYAPVCVQWSSVVCRGQSAIWNSKEKLDSSKIFSSGLVQG